MANAPLIQSNFSKGEITDKLRVHGDDQVYYNSLAFLENFFVMLYGGVTRRPGLRFVAEVKDSTKKVRLVPFRFDVKQSYILEFGHLYIRVYRDGGQVQGAAGPVEIVTPYTEADLPEIQYSQAGDVLYLIHQNYNIRKLIRLSHTEWYFETVKETASLVPPTHEQDTDVSGGATLTPGAATGTGVTFTASSAAFLNPGTEGSGDQGRFIVFEGSNNPKLFSRAKITSVTSTTVVVADILDDFPDTSAIASGDWLLRGSPNHGHMWVERYKPVKVNVTVKVRKKTSGTGLMDTFRTADVGKYIKVWGGVIKIDSFTAAGEVEGTLLSELEEQTTEGPDDTILNKIRTQAWTLEVASWDSTFKFPRAIAFFEGRLFAGGSPRFPFRIWGSKSNDFENFAIGFLDDDAIQWDLLAGQVSDIQWLSFASNLMAGGFGSEFRIDGGSNPLSPSNFQVKPDTEHGSVAIQPLRLSNSLIFVQRDGKRLRNATFDFDINAFEAVDLTLLSEHIVGSGIKEIAYQQEPDSIVWCVSKDGHIACLTYEVQENVFGWHRHRTGRVDFVDTGCLANTNYTAYFENIAVIPHPSSDKDQVWVVVKRKINGVWKRYIEYFDDDGVFYNQLNTDASLTFGQDLLYGDGTTTVFTASFDIQNTADVDVYVNGVLQTITTDYTVDIATDKVTFVTAPVDRAKIQFCNKRKVTTLNLDFPFFNQSIQQYRSINRSSINAHALKQDGTLWSWGDNFQGQLGDGTTIDKWTPIQTGTDTNWRSVSAGWLHSNALKSDGTLWAWGLNAGWAGNLGLGTFTQYSELSPVQVGTDTDWATVSQSFGHVAALKTDGTLWLWGDNQESQLGNGTTGPDVNTPTQLGTDTDWVWAEAYWENTMALKSNGTLWAWGRNWNGELGQGDKVERNTPTQVGTDTDWAKIVQDETGGHVAAIKTDGTLWMWGANGSGQLGLGDNIERLVPTQVGTDTDWHEIITHGQASHAIKKDGTLWAWGDNANVGALGLGDDVPDRNVPTQVGTETDWYRLSGDGVSGIAMKINRTLWTWGSNTSGRLGLGFSVPNEVLVPTQIGVETTWGIIPSHLEGETVAIVGDGIVQDSKVVSGGLITLDTPACRVELGLPYTSRLETLEPEIPNNTLRGRAKRWAELTFHLRNSIGMSIGNAPTRGKKFIPPLQMVEFIQGWQTMDNPPNLFSGERVYHPLGWESKGRFIVEQTQPYPLTILGYTGHLEIGD